MTRFALLFLAILVALFAAELTPPVQRWLVVPWTEGLARVSAALVTLFDGSVLAQGRILRSTTNGFAVSIEAGCNGVEAALVLIAAIIAVRAPWKYKLMGIAAGLARIVGAIRQNEQAVISVSIVTPDVEGVRDVALSIPRVVGREGVVADLFPDLDAGERAALHRSAATLRGLFDSIAL